MGKLTPKWFEFRQNNPGGRLVFNDSVGNYVYIQAFTAAEANSKAEDIGVYFDGVAKGYDCECCGDRWCSVWDRCEGSVDMPKQYVWNRGQVDYELCDTAPRNSEYAVFYHIDGRREYGVSMESEN
jgi:hypothetical protein